MVFCIFRNCKNSKNYEKENAVAKVAEIVNKEETRKIIEKKMFPAVHEKKL